MIQEAIGDIEPSPASVALEEVATRLSRIATTSGPGSVKIKKRLFGELYYRLTEPERRFLTSLIMGEIRQEALEGLVIEAIAKDVSLPLIRVTAGHCPTIPIRRESSC